MNRMYTKYVRFVVLILIFLGLSYALKLYFQKESDTQISSVSFNVSGNKPMSASLRKVTDGPNLLTNGGFESYKINRNGVADGWVSDGLDMRIVSSGAAEGKQAQHIGLFGKEAGHWAEIYREIDVTAGRLYIVDGQFKITSLDGAKVQMVLEFFDKQGKKLATKRKELTAITSGFVLLKSGGRVPIGAASVVFGVHILAMKDQAIGALDVDDLNFRYSTEDAEEPTAPTNLLLTNFTETSIDLKWNASTDNVGVSNYEIYNNKIRLGTAQTTSIQLTGLKKGTLFTLSVKAIDAAGHKSELSNHIQVKTKDSIADWNVFLGKSGFFSSDISKNTTIPASTSLSTNSAFQFMAARDDLKLFFYVQGSNLDTQNVFFLDSDNNGITGYHSSSWPNSGIDYKIENNSLYRFIEETSSWLKAGGSHLDLYSESIGAYIYLDELGAIRPETMKVAYMSKNSLSLPEPGLPMLTISTLPTEELAVNSFLPRETFDVMTNPYMGWAPFSNNKAYSQPVGLVYAGLTWRELEAVEGVFSWNEVEKTHNIDYWAKQNKKTVLRIIMDTSASEANHKDIPDWLYNEIVKEQGVSNAGTWYKDGKYNGFSPNYGSPILINKHNLLINALAKRYDNDPRIAFIEIGSLGHAGEFHTAVLRSMDVGSFPQLAISDQYVQHYLKYFQKIKLGMRKPFPIAAQNHLGLFNDVMGDKNATNNWLDWIQNGWSGIKAYVSENSNPEQVQVASSMPDFWKYSYSGGEISSFYSPLDYFSNERFMETLQEARKSHTSWTIATSIAQTNSEVDISKQVQANLDYFLNTIGYRFILESFTHEHEATIDETIALTTNWNNKGVAPFYYDWPLEFALVDASGNLLESTRITAIHTDIRSWLPGRHREITSMHIPSELPNGSYTLVVGITDPYTQKPGIKLAMNGERADGWYELDNISIRSNR